MSIHPAPAEAAWCSRVVPSLPLPNLQWQPPQTGEAVSFIIGQNLVPQGRSIGDVVELAELLWLAILSTPGEGRKNRGKSRVLLGELLGATIWTGFEDESRCLCRIARKDICFFVLVRSRMRNWESYSSSSTTSPIFPQRLHVLKMAAFQAHDILRGGEYLEEARKWLKPWEIKTAESMAEVLINFTEAATP